MTAMAPPRPVRRRCPRRNLCRGEDRRQRHLRERGWRRGRLLAERPVLGRAPEPDRRQRRRDLLRRRHQDRLAWEPGRAERDRAQRQGRRSQRLRLGRQPRRVGERGQGQLHLGVGRADGFRQRVRDVREPEGQPARGRADRRRLPAVVFEPVQIHDRQRRRRRAPTTSCSANRFGSHVASEPCSTTLPATSR